MTKPACEKCGNDGSTAGLYLTVDARFTGTDWVLEGRDDTGGKQLDCLNCDHRTPWPEHGLANFPITGDAR